MVPSQGMASSRKTFQWRVKTLSSIDRHTEGESSNGRLENRYDLRGKPSVAVVGSLQQMPAPLAEAETFGPRHQRLWSNPLHRNERSLQNQKCKPRKAQKS